VFEAALPDRVEVSVQRRIAVVSTWKLIATIAESQWRFAASR
jgi:hypothetical protein